MPPCSKQSTRRKLLMTLIASVRPYNIAATGSTTVQATHKCVPVRLESKFNLSQHGPAEPGGATVANTSLRTQYDATRHCRLSVIRTVPRQLGPRDSAGAQQPAHTLSACTGATSQISPSQPDCALIQQLSCSHVRDSKTHNSLRTERRMLLLQPASFRTTAPNSYQNPTT